MKLSNFFVWIPRILSILVAIFLSIFAFDVFVENYSFTEKLVGYFFHMIPTLIVVVCLIVSWRFYLIGGVLYICAGIISVLIFNTYKEFVQFFIVSFPVFLIGCLFIVSFFIRRSNLV